MSILQKIVEKKLQRVSDAEAHLPLRELKAIVKDLPPTLDFFSAIKNTPKPIALIAEIKKASPSKGIIRADFSHIEIAKIYKQCQVDACSVITEQDFFLGSPEFIKDVRAILPCPILRKDFIVKPYQVYEARALGADAILLIAECLSNLQSAELAGLAQELGLEVLFELHSLDELPKALSSSTKIIGINNRDLRTFKVNLQTTLDVKKHIPEGFLVVSESGIQSKSHVDLLVKHKVSAMLVGSYFMQSKDIVTAINSLYEG